MLPIRSSENPIEKQMQLKSQMPRKPNVKPNDEPETILV
jgi:hypothetical protein